VFVCVCVCVCVCTRAYLQAQGDGVVAEVDEAARVSG